MKDHLKEKVSPKAKLLAACLPWRRPRTASAGDDPANLEQVSTDSHLKLA